MKLAALALVLLEPLLASFPRAGGISGMLEKLRRPPLTVLVLHCPQPAAHACVPLSGRPAKSAPAHFLR